MISFAFFICSGVSCSKKIPSAKEGEETSACSVDQYPWFVSESYQEFPLTACGAGVICGTLSYEKLVQDAYGQALSDQCAPAFPVQYALVELRDAANTSTLLTTSTDDIGNFSLYPMPPGHTRFTVRLVAKTRDEDLDHRVHVMDDSEGRNSFRVDFNHVVPGQRVNYTVPFKDKQTNVYLSGAFNILSLITRSQDRLTSRYGAFFDKKLEVYWKSGNNNTRSTGFTGPADESLQPYLYVQGGMDGSQHLTDTDEFDDAVVLHEFSHYVDYIFSTYDTPGGSHTFYAEDPRLAWGEGWADFLSAYLRSVSSSDSQIRYRDSIGLGNDSSFAVDYDISEFVQTKSVSVTSNGVGTTANVTIKGPQYEWSVRQFLWAIYTQKKFSMNTIWNAFKSFRNPSSTPPTNDDASQTVSIDWTGMLTATTFFHKLKNQLTSATDIASFKTMGELYGIYSTSDFAGKVNYPPFLPIGLYDGSRQQDEAVPNVFSTSNQVNWTDRSGIARYCESPSEGTGSYASLIGAGYSAGTFGLIPYFCWITGRRTLEMSNSSLVYNFSFSPSSNYLSRRWFRLEPQFDGEHMIFIKMGCLSASGYTTGLCTDPASSQNSVTNNYVAASNHLDMRVWAAPEYNSRARVSVDSDLLLMTLNPTNPTQLTSDTDDDDFDLTPSNANEQRNGVSDALGTISDYNVDDNVNTATATVTLEADKVYYLEVNADKGAANGANSSEARFRIHVCYVSSSGDCRTTNYTYPHADTGELNDGPGMGWPQDFD